MLVALVSMIDITQELACARPFEYNAMHLPDIITQTKDNDTCIYAHTHRGSEAAFLVLGCINFPYAALKKGRKVPLFGVFNIPSEIGRQGKRWKRRPESATVH